MIRALNEIKTIDNGTKSPIAIQKTRTYDNVPILQAYSYFEKLKSDKIALNESYKDIKWIFQDKLKDSRYNMNFRMLEEPDKLKKFMILVLMENELNTAYAVFRFLSKILIETNNLKTKDINLDHIHQVTSYGSQMFSAYLDFIQADSAETRCYIEKLEQESKKHDYGCRDLPMYESIMIFNDIMERFIKQDLKFNIKYYPIVLWWKLTILIPIRPLEFFTFKTYDFYRDNDKYYIHVNRCLKSDPNNKLEHEIPLVSSYQINKELYDLFIGYIRTLKIGPEEYIFNSYDVNVRYEREFMGRNILNNLLDEFYTEIVCEKYGYNVIKKNTKQFLQEEEIEHINFGDTRHLAFLNLILSGFNPYTIAQMGGHRSINSQMSYYSGATSYCTSKAFCLANGMIKFKSSKALPMMTWKLNQLKKEEIDLSKARRYGNGYCISTNFPFECYSSDCQSGSCPYYVYDNEGNLNEDIKRQEEEIEHKVNILKELLFKEPKDCVEREEVCNCIQEKIIMLTRLYRNKLMLEEL